MSRKGSNAADHHVRPRAVDVARRAGVSESAVSRTFHDGSVSANVRARVLTAAKELGFRPNVLAQTLLSRRSNVIAILMTPHTNSHFPEVLTALSHAAEAHGLRVMLFTVDTPGVASGVVDQVLSYQVDGVLSLTEISAADANVLESQGVALVLYNRASAPYAVDLVSCDHFEAGRALGEHLLGLGHRDFGIVGGPPLATLAIDRAAGVLSALAAAAIDRASVPCTVGDFGYNSGRVGTRAVLAKRPGISALVCINDIMAIGAIDEAATCDMHVPDDLSVAAFDGVPAGRWDRYRLTTMRQPLDELATAALDTLARRIGDPEASRATTLLACTLDRGHSAGPRR